MTRPPIRLVIIAVLAVLGALAVGALGDAAPPPAPAGPVILSAVTADRASTWFCAAAGAGTPSPVTHEISIANPTDAPITARFVGSAPSGQAQQVTDQQIAARSVLTVAASKLAPEAGSVTVEVGVGAAVSHRLHYGEGFDEQPCSTSSSSSWYFPAVDTSLGASAQLWVSNPFGSDSSFDVTVYSNEGVRQPPSLNGVLVAAHSTRVVELGDSVERRDQFAVSVVAREGRLLAEIAQTSDGSKSPRGLRISRGAPALSTRLDFADGIVGTGIRERYILFNPGDDDAAVAVSVLPYGFSADALPEPISVDLPARRFAVVDLGQETRVPPDVPHSVVVAVVSGPAVAAARVVGVAGGSGGQNGSGVRSGLASTIGSPIAASKWIIPAVDPSSAGRVHIAVRNPRSSTIARVSVSAVADTVSTSITGDQPLEIAPDGSLLIDVTTITVRSALVVTSDQAVVVDVRTSAIEWKDLSVAGGVPDMGGAEDLGDYTPPTITPETSPETTAVTEESTPTSGLDTAPTSIAAPGTAPATTTAPATVAPPAT